MREFDGFVHPGVKDWTVAEEALYLGWLSFFLVDSKLISLVKLEELLGIDSPVDRYRVFVSSLRVLSLRLVPGKLLHITAEVVRLLRIDLFLRHFLLQLRFYNFFLLLLALLFGQFWR